MRNKIFIFLAVSMFCLILTVLHAQPIKDFEDSVAKTVTNNKQEIYNDQTVIFTYPAKWKKASSDIYSQMHQLLDHDLSKINRFIIELEVYTSPNNEGNYLVFDKTQVQDSISIEFLLSERNKTDYDALASGYLTKINLLMEFP